MAAPPPGRDELELEIESLAYGGNGVARMNGFVVFVRRGLPGDKVRARVTKVQRRHAEALAVEVLEPSPQRVEAPCDHYPACGGCRFQDLDYQAQTRRRGAGRDALVRIGGCRSRRSSRSSRLRRSSTTATSSSTPSRRGRRGRCSASTRPAAGTR